MKKLLATLMLLVLLCSTVSAMASGYWYDGKGWWYFDNNGNWDKLYTDSTPMQWNSYMVNHNFPTSAIRDVSSVSAQYNGTPVGCLGITSNKGSNLRSYPTTEGRYQYLGGYRPSWVDNSIIRKLHANETVYVYFSLYDDKGREWYYASCPDGTCGFLYADRIMLIPY